MGWCQRGTVANEEVIQTARGSGRAGGAQISPQYTRGQSASTPALRQLGSQEFGFTGSGEYVYTV